MEVRVMNPDGSPHVASGDVPRPNRLSTADYRARVLALGWTTDPGWTVTERKVGRLLADGLDLAAQLDAAEAKLARVESVAKARAISDRATGRDPRFALDVLAILDWEA